MLTACSDSADTTRQLVTAENELPAATRIACTKCHKKNENQLGPSIKAIAEKYDYNDVEKLVSVVKYGRERGELKWGRAAKPASEESEQNIRLAINWMLNR